MQGLEWGTASSAELLLRSLEWIETNLEYEWVVYLSEQDYPLRPISEIERDLSESEVDCFLEGGPVEWGSPFPSEAEGLTRYHYSFSVFKDEGSEAEIWQQRKSQLSRPRLEEGRVIMPPLIARATEGHWWIGRYIGWPYTCDTRLYAGLLWGNLRRCAVKRVLLFYQNYPHIWHHLSQTMHASEAIWHTAIYNNPRLRVSADNRRLILWEKKTDPRPGIWSRKDFDLLARSGKDFARKFAIGKEEDGILDLIDTHLLHT